MLVVGIAGGTGSGKTTVVEKIVKKFHRDKVVVLPQDAYYRDNSHVPVEKREFINFDHPSSIEFPLLIDHIKKLRDGKTIQRPVYSYLTCTRSNETITVSPVEVVIIEGILILTDPGLRKLMDIKVFVDAEADDRLGRVILRDIKERGRSVTQVLQRYEKIVKPMHLQFIEPTRRYADIIIPQGANNEIGIDSLTSIIEKSLFS